MIGRLFLALCTLAVMLLPIRGAAPDLASVQELAGRGEFKQAAALLQGALSNPQLTSTERTAIESELDQLDRIRLDYALTHEALCAALDQARTGFTRDEFDRWEAEGRFDSRVIDGVRRYLRPSVSNLFFRHPELEPRRKRPADSGPYERALLTMCRAIREQSLAQGRPHVLPKRFRATMTLTVASNVVPDGQVVRAWLPIPREYPAQTGFALVGSSSPPVFVASGGSSIRSMTLEQPARAGAIIRFWAAYDYTAHGVYFDLRAAAPQQPAPDNPALAPFLREAPHVRFSPPMRSLAVSIVGSERNPALKARRLYEWISTNLLYSYAPEYCTVSDLGEYCRSRGYGDCGQMGFLLITLCRLQGIPARWQSGWYTFPEAKTIHDWIEIYLDPHGWVPVDPYMGVWAMRYARALSPGERREIRDFYFGGLDPWRMVANNDHCQVLDPPKRAARSDPVDFQRGELECGQRNIYFNQFRYSLEVVEQPLTP